MDDLQALEAALLSGMDGQSDSLEPLCSIDPTTRRITVPDNVFGVESDEQAKRVYFSVPAVVGDNFDLSKARIQINFRNPNGDLGVYLVKDFAADAEGNATFSWSLRRIVTQYKGTVSFIVCATIAAGNNRIDREWNTTLAQGQVLEGLEVTQEMESLAHDIIGQLILAADEADSAASAAIDQVAATANAAIDQVTATAQTQKDAALTAIQTESISQQNTIAKKAQEALQDIPESYVELSNQVNQMSEDLQGVAPAIIPTVTAPLVTISDGADRPAVRVVTHIEPMQEGSGEASPSNVRPFKAVDSVTLDIANENLLGGMHLAEVLREQAGATINTGAGTVLFAASKVDSKTLMSAHAFKPNTRYTIILYGRNTSGGAMDANIAIRYTDGTFQTISFLRAGADSERIFQTMSGKTVESVRGVWSTDSTVLYYDRCGVFEGAVTADALIPAHGKRHSATLPETVYGADIDWVSGKAYKRYHRIVFDGVTTGAKVDAADEGITTYAYIHYTTIPKAIKNGGKAYANKLRSVGMNTVISIFLPAELTGVTSTDNRDTLLAKYNAVLQSWYNAGTPLEIVYEVENPEEIQLTPQQIDTLKGVNNAWSSDGKTELAYIADTKLYIDQRIAALLNL